MHTAACPGSSSPQLTLTAENTSLRNRTSRLAVLCVLAASQPAQRVLNMGVELCTQARITREFQRDG
eukprot:83312-Chlamydomonas_euryale.AAC.6